MTKTEIRNMIISEIVDRQGSGRRLAVLQEVLIDGLACAIAASCRGDETASSVLLEAASHRLFTVSTDIAQSLREEDANR